MNRIFKTIILIQILMFAIATSVFADEACDDAIADGNAAYNSGNYATAQKHFENVVKWCGGSYGAASSWIQNCKNKQAEIKRAQEQKKQEQKNREQQAQLERKGYMEITDIKFANWDSTFAYINKEGEPLYSDAIRFLHPLVYYNGLADEEKTIEYDYKIFDPYGNLKTWDGAHNGFSTGSGNRIKIKPSHNNSVWLMGLGHNTISIYTPGTYKFELWHKHNKLFETSFKIIDAGIKSKTSTTSVTDCQGHTYPVVKIGNQYWMAENLQCTKYDTQSERAGATLSTSSSSTHAPYYTDGRNATTENSGNLTSSQRKKLGLLYNWAAAVGLATESEAKNITTAFSGRRQGICPNGWHIPTDAEWDAIGVALGGTKNEIDNFPNVGKKLKTSSGWYENGNGTDDYFFAALPAGYAYGSSVDGVGNYAFFWTATPLDDNKAYLRYLYYVYGNLYSLEINKNGAQSVRCIRN